MKINSQYIEETLKLFLEGVMFMFAIFGFTVFTLLSSFMTKNSVVIISNDKEIRSFVEEKLKNKKSAGDVSQLILCLGGKEGEKDE